MTRHSCRWVICACLLGSVAGESALRAQTRSSLRRVAPAGSRSSQYFSRGFDLEQGPDFAIAVDGIPLNLPSGLKAPGWFDDGFLIPEALDGGALIYRRGPYRSDQGAFAVAGSAELATVAGFDRPTAKVGYGGASTDRYGRLFWGDSREDRFKVTYALEGTRSYRPWSDWDGSAKVNGFLRLAPRLPGRGWTFTLLTSEERADGGSVAPDRPLPAGFAANYDDLRVGDGSHWQRVFLGLRREVAQGAGRSDLTQFHGGIAVLRSWANNTHYLRDPFNGDQQEFLDRRAFLGGEWRRQWESRRGPVDWTHRLGVQGRLDQVGAAEVYTTYIRERLDEVMRARAGLLHAAVYGQSTARWAEGWHAFAAARVDTQVNRVYGANPWLRQDRSATLVSPKLGLGYSPAEGTQFRAAWAQGFRLGNAFRDDRPMVRVHSADLAAQTRVLGPWESSVTLWAMDLEGETRFDPLLSAWVLGGPSRRRGLEWFNQAKWGRWSAEGCLSWTRARFREALPGQDRVPGALPRTGVLGLGWKTPRLALSAKFRSLGAYALSPDNRVVSARQDLLDLRAQRTWRDWSVTVEVQNAFTLRKNGRAWYYVSRLPEEPRAGVADSHTKHADPQAIRIELVRRF